MNEPGTRKSKGHNFRVYVATSFTYASFCEIEELAKEHGLRNAQIVRELFFRGLAAYHDDGKLYVEQVVTHSLATAGQVADDTSSSCVSSGLKLGTTTLPPTPLA